MTTWWGKGGDRAREDGNRGIGGGGGGEGGGGEGT